MSTLTVGAGQQYTTIAAAVNGARDGDTINVQAGTYTNDFVSIYKNLTLNAVGGTVAMNATVQPPNGKAILTEGAPGLTVQINGFAFTGAAVPDGNGAGIRYEGGTLKVTNSYFGNNQNGILGAPDPNGVISIDHSEFDHNGTGDGRTHNMYIGDIAQFTLTNSYTHDAVVGHEIKSRAANNTITNNRILDNTGSSSYAIDLPNGGNSTIAGNTIQQSAQSQNPTIIAYGEEGMIRTSNSLNVSGNTIVNDMGRGAALWNAGGAPATFANNSVYGFGSTALVSGSAAQSGTTTLTARPTLDTSAVNLTTAITTASPVMAQPPTSTTSTTPAPDTSTTSTTPTPSTSSTTPKGLVIDVAEEAWKGDAKFVVKVDGKQVGGTYTATALHDLGQSQAISVNTVLGSGPHTVAVSFINDAYGGTHTTDRNLYVTGASYEGKAVSGVGKVLYGNGTDQFTVTVPSAGAGSATASAITGPVTHRAVLNVSEDAYKGDATVAVQVDGKLQGKYQVTALHNQGKSQAIDLGAIMQDAKPHDIAVTFLNDAYAGTSATDRNLYVNSIQIDGKTAPGSAAAMMSAGTHHFAVTVPSIE
jgi:hypothetical protein